MKSSKVFMLCGVALSALLVSGCDSKAHFSQEELDAIKNHKTAPMPAGAAEANAQRMKDGQALYQQRLKEAGLLDANGRRKGEGAASGPPPGAGPGTTPPAAPGTGQ